MNLYDENGYLDIKKVYDLGMPFTFIVGGRGTGKTYGALKMMIEDNKRFMLLRRSQSEVNIIKKDEYSPFKKLNSDMQWTYMIDRITAETSGLYVGEPNGEGGMKPTGPLIGYLNALSTLAHIRGFDGSDISDLIYDEFISEKHVKPISDEAEAFLNAYETICRNRELIGEPPVRVLALSNAVKFANPLFIYLGLVRLADKMRREKKEIEVLPDRGICLIVMRDCPISEMKRDTALYRLSKGTSFESMSLNNEFSSDEVGIMKPQNLKEYVPIVNIGEVTFYKHKSKANLYVSPHMTGSPERFGTSDIELKRFQKKYRFIWQSYLRKNIIFEEYMCEVLLNYYFK